MELIDFEKKGNVIRLFFGENGKQWDDDWDDAPYECNAGEVYPEYVEKTVDMLFTFDVLVEEPADNCMNSPYCKQDFIHKKSWVLWISEEEYSYKEEGKRMPIGIFFGDTLEEIKEKTREYKPIFVEVKDEQSN